MCLVILFANLNTNETSWNPSSWIFLWFFFSWLHLLRREDPLWIWNFYGDEAHIISSLNLWHPIWRIRKKDSLVLCLHVLNFTVISFPSQTTSGFHHILKTGTFHWETENVRTVGNNLQASLKIKILILYMFIYTLSIFLSLENTNYISFI